MPGDLSQLPASETRSKLLKVLKVLNFSGTGKSNIFTFTGPAERPDPTPLDRALLGDGDAFGLARRIEGATPDPPFTGFVSQFPGETGPSRQGLAQPGASLVDDGAPVVAVVLRWPLQELGGGPR